jgi:glycosyltransferase involved in cell wall biosynthesis
VIHAHIDWLPLPLLSRLGVPFLTTMHGRLDLPGLGNVIREFPRAPFVSISEDQRRPLPEANWEATVHHGLPLDLFRSSAEQGSYLAFLGRLTAEKGPEDAIRIAHAVRRPLRIAAKIPAARPSTSRNALDLSSTARTFIWSEKSTMPKSSRSWRRPPPCYFQSIGQSLSDWS